MVWCAIKTCNHDYSTLIACLANCGNCPRIFGRLLNHSGLREDVVSDFGRGSGRIPIHREIPWHTSLHSNTNLFDLFPTLFHPLSPEVKLFKSHATPAQAVHFCADLHIVGLHICIQQRCAAVRFLGPLSYRHHCFLTCSSVHKLRHSSQGAQAMLHQTSPIFDEQTYQTCHATCWL